LDGAVRASVSSAGGSVESATVTLRWWVGANDGWHDPATDTTARFRRRGVAPSFETAVRVPGGDFVQRAYAVTAPSGAGAVAVDFDNESRAPCSVVVFVRVALSASVHLDGKVLRVDGAPALTFGAPPRLWAGGDDVRERVRVGGASAGVPPAWSAPCEIALLAPVPHRTVLRTALADQELEPHTLADPSAVERAWRCQLDRGMQVELPEPFQRDVDAHRADLLLAQPTSAVFAALEDWGFDTEAVDAWSRLRPRDRRASRRRDDLMTSGDTDDPAVALLTVRRSLAREHDGHVDLLPGFRTEWLGRSIAVHHLPLRAGLLSYALRWHGARPALLWDAPRGVDLRAPALDPTWHSPGGTGETLLAEPPTALVAMGSHARGGTRVDDPGSFR
jgi:hypothetical protein